LAEEVSPVPDAPAPFEALLRRSQAEYVAWTRPERPRIDLAWDTSSLAAGARETHEALERAAEQRGGAVDLGRTTGYGMQWLQPLAHVTWPDGTTVLYGPVTPERVDVLLDEAAGLVSAASEFAIGVLAGSRPGVPPIEQHPFLQHEQGRRLLANVARINPERIEHYVARDGYFAAQRMIDRHQQPEAVRQLVTDAGLTGRGGAFFPTGVKWGFLAGAQQPRRYLVCNADEGDPGSWVNRILLEGDPHLVIEGMLIAGYAAGAQHGFIYIRNEYPLAVERMRHAIAQAEEAGLLGENVLGSGFGFTLEVVRGAGAYVCGEETGLIASVQDARGMPRIKPPFPAASGVFFEPTNVNNVESYATVPLILRRGAEWYRELGTERAAGTKVFSFSGDVRFTGFMELPWGVPLPDVLAACGGISEGGQLKALQAGGPLAGYLPAVIAKELTLEPSAFRPHGALVGAGGIVFVSDRACSIDLNAMFAEFLEDESCGRCTTCHGGNQRMAEVFRRTGRGGARREDRHNLELLGDTLLYSNCVHGQASPTIMRNTLTFFEAEYEAHLHEGRCDSLRCPGLARLVVANQADPRLDEAVEICPTGAIAGEPGDRRVDDAACIRCGACVDVAPRGMRREVAPRGTAVHPAVPRSNSARPRLRAAHRRGAPDAAPRATTIVRGEGGLSGLRTLSRELA
jgi:NADH:ubiquinone oxidoreductase subunit F (NADH-binding)